MRGSKWLALALGISLVVQSPLTAMAGSVNTTFEEYRSGSAEDCSVKNESDMTVIVVKTEEDLAELAENCQLDTWSLDKHVQLDADIELKKNTDLTIPSFGGIFEGNGHTIRGLQINGQGSVKGLFRYVRESGVIRNLKVEGRVAPEGTQSIVGGIVGRNYGTISQCSFSGYVSGDSDVGGIVGVNETTGELRQCSNEAVVLGKHSVGGIVGDNHGTLNHCSNTGDINTYGTEVAYNLEDLTIDNIEDLNSTENVAAHTDSGGIAGISDGKIYYCTNAGTVGYQHVGYNTGGIVGRLHQGYLQNCTNTGNILGRKDVGGIAGQMEPFLEIQYLNDKLQELDRETDELFNLMDATYQEVQQYGSQASALTKSITRSLKNASSASGELVGTANDLWYIYNNELTGVNQDLKTLGKEWSDLSNSDGKSEESHEVTVSSGDGLRFDNINIEDIIPDDSDDKTYDSIYDREYDTESYMAALRRFGDSATAHIDNMTRASGDRTKVVNDNLDILNREMESAGNNLEQLSDVLEQGTDQTSDNMDALIAQTKVVRNLIQEIRDDLFRYEGITVEDTSDSDEAVGAEQVSPGAEEAGADETDAGENSTGENDATENGADDGTVVYYDTTSFQQGKVTLCVNRGRVEADSNVGGIVGQIATEYDFDPEDDITVTGPESFDIEQTLKAVVRDSLNQGEVISKKDCAGGIVGKADFGAIISCESYGDVSSTGGSNVGGIAGTSAYTIRGCYTMGALSGKNNVGGIAGKGCDIFYSYAYNTLELTGECAGAIAGMVEDDGILYGNYYVAGTEGGIDGIGYTGGATPLSYEEFCNSVDMPKEFSAFTITFLADGEELASYTCSYGEGLSEEQIPAIPEKEGYYGRWPEFDFNHITGNQVLEAEYEHWITSLASKETDENGKPKLLVEGEFLPEETLTVSEDGEEIHFAIEDNRSEGTEEYEKAVEVRVLCENTENAIVEVKTDSGFVTVDSTVKGSYLQFPMEKPGTFRVTYAEKNSMIIWYLTGGVVLAGAVVIIILLIRKKRLKKELSSGNSDE